MTGTDIATVTDERPAAPIAIRTETVRALADFAGELDAATRIAEAVCRTNFVPEAYRGKPNEAAAAILTGHELGFSPMAALRAFYPAPGGRAEMYARAMQAVAIAAGHDVWVAEQNDEHAVVRGWVKGTPRDRVLEVKWDQDRVRKAELLKEKGNHVKFPQQMMVARGIAEMSRLVAPAELHGIYCPEERDPIAVEATVGARIDTPSIASLTAPSGNPAAATDRVPVTPDIPGDQAEQTVIDIGDAEIATDAPPPITPEQSKTLHDLARALGKNTKAKLGPIIQEVTGKTVDDTRLLSSEDAGLVIAALQAEAAQAQAGQG